MDIEITMVSVVGRVRRIANKQLDCSHSRIREGSWGAYETKTCRDCGEPLEIKQVANANNGKCKHTHWKQTETNGHYIETCVSCGEVLDFQTLAQRDRTTRPARWLIVEESNYPFPADIKKLRRRIAKKGQIELNWADWPRNDQAWRLLADYARLTEMIAAADNVAVFGWSPLCQDACVKAIAMGKTLKVTGQVGEWPDGAPKYDTMSTELLAELLAGRKPFEEMWVSNFTDEKLDNWTLPFGSMPNWDDPSNPEANVNFAGRRLADTPLLVIEVLVSRGWFDGIQRLVMEEYLTRNQQELLLEHLKLEASISDDEGELNQSSIIKPYHDFFSGETLAYYVDPEDMDRQESRKDGPNDIEEDEGTSTGQGWNSTGNNGYGRNYESRLIEAAYK